MTVVINSFTTLIELVRFAESGQRMCLGKIRISWRRKWEGHCDYVNSEISMKNINNVDKNMNVVMLLSPPML